METTSDLYTAPMNEIQQMRERLARRSRALNRMAADLSWLISQPCGSVRWLSTQRDLVEMVHLVAQTHTLHDDRGQRLTRAALARRAFAVVAQPLPRHLRHVVLEIGNRRTPWLSMLYRYQELEHVPDIIGRFVEQSFSLPCCR